MLLFRLRILINNNYLIKMNIHKGKTKLIKFDFQ